MDSIVLTKSSYRFGSFVLDAAGRKLTCQGHPVRLTTRPFDLLLYAVENVGRVIEKDELLTAVWGNRAVEEANLSQTISVLRRALRDAGGEDPFVTIPGRGYRMVAEVIRDAEASPYEAPAASLEEPVAGSENGQLDRGSSAQSALTARVRAAMNRRIGWAGIGIVSMIIIALVVAKPTRPGSVLPEAAFDPPPKSLAVLAFTNMSSDRSEDYLAEGLSEELIDTLARDDTLHVSAQTSAFAFKGSHATVGEIARKLDVGAVLEGVVRRSGGRVRISAHFINARTGFAYWSGEYDRPDGDILQLESDLAGKVAASLGATLLNSPDAQVEAGGTRNARAQDAYLRGMALSRFVEETSLQSAIAAFDDAIRLDPGFANARAGKSRSMVQLSAAFDDVSDSESRRLDDEALDEARRAVALAPGSALAHSAYALVLNGNLDLRAASAESEKAHELGAGMYVVEMSFARAEAYYGHCDAAMAAEKRSIALDPLASSTYIQAAVIYRFCRDDNAALAALDTEATLGAAYRLRSAGLRAQVDLDMGKPEAALKDCGSLCQTASDGWMVLAIAHGKLGRWNEAKADIAAVHKDGDDPALDMLMYAQLGRRAEALKALQAMFKERPFL